MRNTGYLLGAGASVDAKLPMSRELTSKIYFSINNIRKESSAKSLLNFVAGSLMHEMSTQGFNPFEAPDIEDIYSALDDIEKRHESSLNPFIGPWHPALDTFDDGSGLSVNTARQALRNRLIEHLYLSADDTVRVRYLSPIINSLISQDVRFIATLNYDNALELLIQSLGYEIDFCIPELPNEGGGKSLSIQLLKLHGSIDWSYDSNEELPQPGSMSEPLKRLSPHEMGRDRRERAIVFGRDRKLQVKGPFLHLLNQFSSVLNANIDNLIVIGYSFRDQHINYFIERWLASKTDSNLLILDPNSFKGDGMFETRFDTWKKKYSVRVNQIEKTTTEGLEEAISRFQQ